MCWSQYRWLSKNKFNFYLVFTDDAENANAYLVEILEN